jgi:tRNA-specific 2-thiouridylase
VIVGTADELDGWAVHLDEVNWLADPLTAGDRCFVQVRHRGPAVSATVRAGSGDTLDLALEEPARAITPGQSGVLYTDAGQVLGGGVIG